MNENTNSGTKRPLESILAYSSTILVGAFLLFMVQPMIGKYILPWFGGCPAVWTTCMLFFQIVLFAGYVYAHLSQRWLSPRGQVLLHLALAVVALALLPIAPSPSWKPDGIDAPTGRILLLLLSTVGLPYFVLAGTSPLVQAWFSRRCPGQSPYRLYSLSNVGSLTALLGYPFWIEPRLDVSRQSWWWSGTYFVYAGSVAICLATLWHLKQSISGEGPNPAPNTDRRATSPTWPLQLLWVLLPCCASVMLLATTNHVCQNIAVIPFLWIVPLTLYLVSFIVCFDHERWYVRKAWAYTTLVFIFLVIDYDSNDWLRLELSAPLELALYFATLLGACMVCHGELVRLRPSARHLTEFYLLISAGGALGGALVSLAAPRVFLSFFEWPIGLVTTLGITAAALAVPMTREKGRWHWAGLAIVLVSMGYGLYGLLNWGVDSGAATLARARNFYGVISVEELNGDGPLEQRRVLRHGPINHGMQYMSPEKSRHPTAYYSKSSGIAQVIAALQKRGPMRVGVLGLGVGTMAAFARPGDDYRFYEINPEVLRLAQTYFSYLRDCQGKTSVALGDGRMSLDREPSQHYDLIALDAFSGDSVPAHLLTREAFEIYTRHLAPDGVIAVNITNAYLRLAPVIRGQARQCGLEMIRVYSVGDEDYGKQRSDWALLTKAPAIIAAVPQAPPKHYHDDFEVPLWTDQRSNLFAILETE